MLVLLSGCDSNSPTPSLESQFDMQVGAPVNQSLTGPAALGSDLSFDEQGVFTVPGGPFGETMTIIQLSGENDEGVAHDLSFLRVADGPIEEDTYELGGLCEADCGPRFFPPEEWFTADYGRRTADSLHSYPIDSGTVTVTTVTDEGVEGTFDLTSSLELSIARDDLEAFIDSMRSGPPRDTALTLGPRPDLEFLEQPMTIEGSFAATSNQTLSGQVPHFGGIGGGVVSDTTITIP